MICGVTETTPMRNDSVSKTTRFRVRASPIVREAEMTARKMTSCLRRTRSPNGEMSKMPVAYLVKD